MADKARPEDGDVPEELPVVQYSSQQAVGSMGTSSEDEGPWDEGSWVEPKDPHPQLRRKRRSASPDLDFEVELDEV
jgi:hypothetical protein